MELLIALLTTAGATEAVKKGLARGQALLRSEVGKLPAPLQVLLALIVATAWSALAPAVGIEFDPGQIPDPVVVTALAGLLYQLAKPLRGLLPGGDGSDKES